jgi:hypothetical protein
MSMKKFSMTPSGIEPATFRLGAQCLILLPNSMKGTKNAKILLNSQEIGIK